MHALTQWALAGIIVSSAIGALIICYVVIRYGFSPPTEGGYTSPAELNRRLVTARLGHDAAGVCFAVSVLLAVVAMVVPPRAAPRPERPAAPDPALARLETEFRALEQRLIRAESRLDAAESRAERVETSAARVERAPATAPGRRQRAQIGRQAPPARRPAPVVTRDESAAVPAPVALPRESAPPSATPAALPRENVGPPAPPAVPRESVAPPPPATPPRASAPVPSAPQASSSRTPDADTTTPAPGVEDRGDARDLKTKLRDDWSTIKREAQGAGGDIRKAFRRFREWLVD